MKRIAVFVCMIFPLLAVMVVGQAEDYNGYVVDNFGNRLECYLSSRGNVDKGASYRYYFEKGQKPIDVDVEHLREFGIEGELVFSREFISIDVSEDEFYDKGEYNKQREIVSGHVFLEYLIENDVFCVYYFVLEGKEYFFFQKGNSGIQLLQYKKYKQVVDDGNISGISYDNTYREQLKEEFPCSMKSNVAYKRKELLKYFKTYMQERGIAEEFSTEIIYPDFAVSLRCNIDLYSYLISESSTLNFDFGQKIKINPGVELSYMFPFNENMLGVFVAADYFSLNMLYEHSSTSNSELSLRGFGFPFGAVFDIELAPDFSFYAKAGIVPMYLFSESALSLYRPENETLLVESTAPVFTAGLSYKRLTMDVSYVMARNLSKKLVFNPSELDQATFRISYKIIRPGH